MPSVLAITALLASAAFAGPEATHTGLLTTEHFDVRFRPGSHAAAAAERDGAMAERDLADICRRLAYVPDGRFVAYLYGKGTAMSAAARAPNTGEVDLVMVRRGGRMDIWVDGIRLAEGEVDAEPCPVGIGLHSGTVRFESVRVRELK